uniref:(northern house mosquito) hypothetical protein n=1 Tax=Culex pipiens TaxID=7175 RepID=A0A8D8AH93_CULPI
MLVLSISGLIWLLRKSNSSLRCSDGEERSPVASSSPVRRFLMLARCCLAASRLGLALVSESVLLSLLEMWMGPSMGRLAGLPESISATVGIEYSRSSFVTRQCSMRSCWDMAGTCWLIRSSSRSNSVSLFAFEDPLCSPPGCLLQPELETSQKELASDEGLTCAVELSESLSVHCSSTSTSFSASQPSGTNAGSSSASDSSIRVSSSSNASSSSSISIVSTFPSPFVVVAGTTSLLLVTREVAATSGEFNTFRLTKLSMTVVVVVLSRQLGPSGYVSADSVSESGSRSITPSSLYGALFFSRRRSRLELPLLAVVAVVVDEGFSTERRMIRFS